MQTEKKKMFVRGAFIVSSNKVFTDETIFENLITYLCIL